MCTVQIIYLGSHTILKDKRRNAILIKDYIDAIKEHLQGKPYRKHVYGIIAISNRHKGDPGLTTLREAIIEVASKQPYWGEPRPIRWLMLAHKLDQARDSQPDPTMKFDEVLTIALELGIGKDELSVFLSFHHNLGELIYFDEPGLDDTVILSPQWLGNIFRYVISQL